MGLPNSGKSFLCYEIANHYLSIKKQGNILYFHNGNFYSKLI